MASDLKAEKWLKDHTTSEKTRVDVFLDQYTDYLKETKSKSHASQYSGFIRLYIQPVIGVFRMNKLTEGDLQTVIDLAYSKNNLADKTLRDVRGCLLNWLKWCRKRGKTSLHPEDLTIPAGAKKSEKRIVSPDGLKTLFSCSTTLWRGKPTEDFYIHAYRFAVLTGLRPGELRALEDKNDMESRGRIENVQELKSNILGFLEQDPEDATLSGFLNEIALYTDLDSVEADDNCVTMMTIHSAKGLEFPVVYVVGMEEGIFPGSSAMYDEEELEEERRLCYVAMTRAREKLVMTNARQRMLYGRTSANKASRFLEEIPEEDMHWESKPEPRFGAANEEGFGGSRWGDDFGGGSFGGSSYSGSSSRSGGYVSGGVHTYKSTKPAAQTLRTSSRGSTPAAPSVGLIQLSQGDQVEHTAFGKGTVVSVKPMGGDALAEVAFDTVGKKKLMLKSAGAHMRKL